MPRIFLRITVIYQGVQKTRNSVIYQGVKKTRITVTYQGVQKTRITVIYQSNACKLCLREKFKIAFNPDEATLNLRTEIFGHCRHIDNCLFKQDPD